MSIDLKKIALLVLALNLTTIPLFADEDDIDESDPEEEYDLYDRNQDQADFNPYNFPDDKQPNNTNSMYYPYDFGGSDTNKEGG